MLRNTALVVVITLVASRPDVVQVAHAAAQQSSSDSYVASTTAILVDVVVRDGHGRPVLDLTADEFELFEDGVAQQIDSFSRITRGGGIGIGVKWKQPGNTVAVLSDAPSSEAANAGPAGESTTALVFDHLSSEALDLARNATLNYVPMSGEAEVKMAVFATDPGLHTVQGYTTDRAAIREAVRRVLPSGTAMADQKGERRDELLDRQKTLSAELSSATTGATAAGAAAGGEIGSREQELRMIALERSMIESFDALDRGHRGYDTTVSLLTVIRTMMERPGRKSIVFFSEGLPVTPVLSARLDNVIDAANRANVTVYAIDARGLRTRSSLVEARKEVDQFADERRQQVATGSTRTDRPMLQAFERVEDTIRLDSRTGLARLAGDTGGFLVDESNDLTSAFQRIDEDNRFHYLLTYSPRKPLGDGKFRTIAVKVGRPGVDVFSRKGYRAVRTPRSLDAGGFETSALALLDRTPLPNAFPLGAGAFTFPDPQNPGIVPIVVRLTTDALKYNVDPQRSSYAAQVAVIVRLKDAQGKPVQTLSQQYVMSGDAKDVEAARKGTILFYREPQLPPGVYTMETIAFDVLADDGSARVSTITVPPAATGALGMSSLVLVDHLEQVEHPGGERTERAAPFYVKNTLVYPNVGDSIIKKTRPDLPFFFTVYRGPTTPLRATADLMKNGQVIASVPLELETGDEPRLQQLGKLSVGTLPPGTYELRIRVASPTEDVTRSAFFTLEN